jgi:hypothetical protein
MPQRCGNSVLLAVPFGHGVTLPAPQHTAAGGEGKMGDHVRSRTDTAMVNEALCKPVAHNP